MQRNHSPLSIALLLAGCFIVLTQCGCGGGMSASETKARDALKDMGAIIANDAQGVHPATIMMMSEKIEQDIDNAIEEVGKLKHLTHLETTDLPVTDDHLKTIAGLSKINSLVLSGSQITDAGLKNIAGLSKMDALYIDNTAISPAGVETVSGFKNLKILEMSGCDVMSNLAPLTKLENLEWLILDNLTIDSSATDILGGLPRLTRLTIKGSTIAAEDLDRLKSTKPSLSIDLTSTPEEVNEVADPASAAN